MMMSSATFLSPLRASSMRASNVDVTIDDDAMGEVYYGERLASCLDVLLTRVRREGLAVDAKDKDLLNRCFAPGNPQPELTCNVSQSQSLQYLESLCEGLHSDPRGRSHVVDHYESDSLEDSIWLSLPKWQAALGINSISWSIVTVRSIERACFREVFQDGFDVKHLHGTAMISSSPSKGDGKALFSDQPRMVAHHGQQMAQEQDFVIRVFRCAPRQSLRDGIAAVLEQDCPSNVFDVWIRHHEVPENVSGFGYYRHDLGSEVTLLQLLTEIDENGIPRGISFPISLGSRSEEWSEIEDLKDGQTEQQVEQHEEELDSLAYSGDLEDEGTESDEWDDEQETLPSVSPALCMIGKDKASEEWGPFSPTMATASSSFTTALHSPDAELWPETPHYPDPFLFRAISEDADFVTALEEDVEKENKTRDNKKKKKRNKKCNRKRSGNKLSPLTPTFENGQTIFRKQPSEPRNRRSKKQLRRKRSGEEPIVL